MGGSIQGGPEMFRQQSRCRRRNGHCSVLAGYGARPQLHRSGEDGVHPEHFQADGGSRDIDDGIHRAHLMEMYFFRSSAVYAGFRLRQQGKNRKGSPLDGIGKGACLNKCSYIRHSPVMVRMAAAGVPFFLRQYVNPCSPDAVLLRPAAFQLPLPVHMQFGQFPFQVFPVRSQINQGGQIHISADARAAIIDQGSHDGSV